MHKVNVLVVLLSLWSIQFAKCQIINRAPHFIPQSGDMARFSLSENTSVGSPVYQLKGKKSLNNQWLLMSLTVYQYFKYCMSLSSTVFCLLSPRPSISIPNADTFSPSYATKQVKSCII